MAELPRTNPIETNPEYPVIPGFAPDGAMGVVAAVREAFAKRSFDERGTLGLGFMTLPFKAITRTRAASREHPVLSTVAAGTVVSLAFAAAHNWRELGTSFEADMQDGYTVAKTKILSFDEVMDMRVAKVNFKTDVDAHITVKVGGPGPDWLWPDYDSQYGFEGIGRCNLFVDWTKIQQQLDGNGLKVALNPEDTWMECSWLKTSNSQDDDFERNFEHYYDALGDAAGAVLPGVSGSSMDEKMNQTDDNIRQSMSGKALDEFGKECTPQIQDQDKQAVQNFVDALAASQGINTKTITYVWAPGEVGIKREENLPNLDKGELSIDSWDFDESSCDTTDMKVHKLGAGGNG